MALKVVPADDERCDIHNGRNPPEYICKSCLKELGVEPEPAVSARGGPIRSARRALRRGPIRQARRAIRLRSRSARRILIGAGIGLLIGAIVVAVMLAVGGRSGGGN